MDRVWLKFEDENGEETRLEMERDRFMVGRHSACDLTITDSRLSREHVRFERDGNNFTVSDLGSSNGTTVNGRKLTSPAELKDGDVVNLGGGLEITVEIELPAEADPLNARDADVPGANTPEIDAAGLPASSAGAAAFTPAATPPASEGIPTTFFIIAPLLGIFVLAIVIGAVALLGGGKDKDVVSRDDSEYSSDDNDTSGTERDRDKDKTTPKPGKSATPFVSDPPSNGGLGSTPPPTGGTTTPPSGDAETAKVERSGAEFLKQVAQNDANPFLTGEQARRVNAKVRQLGRSSALADNLNSARRGAAKIKSIAAARNLSPQFLAVAAVTKLGSSRGDVSQTAESIAEVYDQLEIRIGSSLGDDALLLVAAYDQGAAGEYMKLMNTIESIAKTKGAPDTREIRTIWYLENAGKITAAEFDRALTFLAIGTIAQNPKEFGVNAEALRL